MIAWAVTPILNVSDIGQGFAWFEKLGWTKGYQWGGPPKFGAVGSGWCEICLCQEAQGGRGNDGVRSTTGEGGSEMADRGVWMPIWAEDVDAIHRHSTEQGHDVAFSPTDRSWCVREMHLRHPDGHVFRISQGIVQKTQAG